MVSRIAAFVIWAAVAGSVVFWAMRLFVQPVAAPAHTTVVSSASGFKGDLTRLFGVDETPPMAAGPAGAPAASADARFRLIGVVAPRSLAAQGEGLALIAMDGKPPRAYRVGTAVDGDMVLLAVHSRGASLGPRGQPAQVDLSLPALPPPATGSLSSLGSAPQAQRLQPGLPGNSMQLPAPPPIDPPDAPGRSVDESPPEQAPTLPQTSPRRSRSSM